MDDPDGPPRPRHWISVQLRVDASRREPADLAYSWIRDLAERFAGPATAELAALPSRPVSATESGIFGIIEVGRTSERHYLTTARRTFSDTGSTWLRKELDNMPWTVQLRITGDGDPLNAGLLLAAIDNPRHSPGWLILQAEFPADRFTDPINGKSTQQDWIDALSAFADKINPGFGHVAYVFQDYQTSLEACTHVADIPRDEIEPDWTTGKSRLRLPGYSWITIVPQELADRLGGAPALARTGAFFEVRQLTEGGVWLRAVEDFRDYTLDRATVVFRTLAPVLRPGSPRANLAGTKPPVFLVFEDPSRR